MQKMIGYHMFDQIANCIIQIVLLNVHVDEFDYIYLICEYLK